MTKEKQSFMLFDTLLDGELAENIQKKMQPEQT